MTPAFRRIAIAAVAIALVAAACGGSDPGDDAPSTIAEPEGSPTQTLEDGSEADTADHHGDPDLTNQHDDTDDDNTANHHDTDDETADQHDTDDTDDETADQHDTDDTDDETADRHGSADAPTRYDADIADAEQTISVEVAGGAPVGGHQRVEVDLGSVVAVTVTADTTEEVHVHSYDILRAVSDGHPAHFAFTAEIPGVFEVELEGSGRLLLQLEIS